VDWEHEAAKRLQEAFTKGWEAPKRRENRAKRIWEMEFLPAAAVLPDMG